ncbi:MAG TPA: GNAT family N-acetyltransferase, partial [Holophagaceae bacterium]|nr:GNAT family N-acetyltransferase [Holophagaceae bacterium]
QYRDQFPGASTKKILVGGEAAGRVDTAEEDGRLHIIDFAVMPGAQGRGAGSGVLRGILEKADAAGLVADLHVEAANPARRLYARFGFVERSGDGINLFMERQPAAPSAEQDRRLA